MSPRVWNKRKGADSPPSGAVLVDRTTRFGNPFRLPKDARSWPVERQRQHLADTFGVYLRQRPALVGAIRAELAGKHLVCWCSPLPCHADILLRVAAGGEP